MEIIEPHTTPATLRRQAATRHRSSSNGRQRRGTQHGGRGSPDGRRVDHAYPDDGIDSELDGNFHALGERAPVNSEELGDQEVPELQVPSGEADKGSGEDLMEAFCSPAGGIVAALRSVASCDTWMKRPHVSLRVPRIFASGPGEGELGKTEAAGALSVPEEVGEERDAEKTKEEDEGEESLIPQSKYIDISPLYQDYWLQCVNEELSRKRSVPKFFIPLGEPGPSTPPLRTPADPTSQSRSLAFSLWQDRPEVRESGLLDVMTPREKRLQEAMFEMIGSEASYLKSLMVAVNHFLGSQELRLILPRMEHHILFSNLTEVKRVSERFLQSLEARQEENVVIPQVGDLVLLHRTSLRSAYVPYITNMMYQEALVSRLMQENQEFVEVLRKLEEAPVCQRKSIKSFLVLPFQRITRLRIILENILKLTPPDSEPVSTLIEAISAIHQIVTECDTGVQRMKQTEELVHLAKLVVFDSVKCIPLISRGRCLLKDGSLRHIIVEGSASAGSEVSFKDIYLHLFNDLLLLSHKEAGGFNVLDYATFPAHVEVGPLKTEFLGLPSESFLLHLSQNHAGASTALILTAETSSDREAWITLLTSSTNGENTRDP